jgi:hypothetical protein
VKDICSTQEVKGADASVHDLRDHFEGKFLVLSFSCEELSKVRVIFFENEIHMALNSSIWCSFVLDEEIKQLDYVSLVRIELIELSQDLNLSSEVLKMFKT